MRKKLKGVKTVHALNLEISRTRGVPLNVIPYSTLNEKLNIGDPTPPSSGYPNTNFFAIGIGGHRNAFGEGGASVTNALSHGVTDSALFEQVPFVLVPTTNDITPAERDMFRCRKVETHNGVEYFAYYLKKCSDVTNVSPELKVIEISNGTIVNEVPYNPSVTSLTPSPIDISNVNTNTLDGKYLVAISTITIPLTSEDIDRIVEAVTIIYNDERRAVISEAALVSAYDTDIVSNIGDITVNVKEVRAAQIMAFVTTQQPLIYGTSQFDLSFSLSESLPLPPIYVL